MPGSLYAVRSVDEKLEEMEKAIKLTKDDQTQNHSKASLAKQNYEKKYLRARLDIISRSFVKYEATLHGDEVEGIWAESDALNRKANDEVEGFAGDIEDTAEEFANNMRFMPELIQIANQEAAEETLEYFLTHIEVDGTKLKDIIGGPEQWMLKKNVNMQEMTTDMVVPISEPAGWKITWDGPSMEEF